MNTFDSKSYSVDWETLPPLELMQYLVAEAIKDEECPPSLGKKCMEILSPTAEVSTCISWADSTVSSDYWNSPKRSGNDFSIVHSKMGKDEKLSRTVGKMGHSSANPVSPNLEYSKKDFSEVMNNWLRDNWTNPYTDDEELNQIADSCGCTPSVVSNWLINARTRKWRPSIVKAFENNRPASLLHEDSINIFDGKPLRRI